MENINQIFDSLKITMPPPSQVIESNYKNAGMYIKYICENQTDDELEGGWYWGRLKKLIPNPITPVKSFGRKNHFYLFHIELSFEQLCIITLFKDNEI